MVELNFKVSFSGSLGEQVALVSLLSSTGLPMDALDIDYIVSWEDFLKLLELEAQTLIEDANVVTGVY